MENAWSEKCGLLFRSVRCCSEQKQYRNLK